MSEVSFLLKITKELSRRKFRGSYRLAKLIAHRFPSLQGTSVQTDDGSMFLDLRTSSARAILADPVCRSGESRLMKAVVMPGDFVLDIGAHLGFYTLVLSNACGDLGQVLAFEPNKELLPSLRKTLDSKTNVRVMDVALSDSNCEAELFVPEDASMGSLTDWTGGAGGEVHNMRVSLRRLDDLLEETDFAQPSFIKCDVEGGEISVFRGGERTLNRVDAPIVLFEIIEIATSGFGTSTADTPTFLSELPLPKYVFFKLEEDSITRINSFDFSYANIVAVPESRIALIDRF